MAIRASNGSRRSSLSQRPSSATGNLRGTTKMPGSKALADKPEVRFVRRFSRTERMLHWTNALGFSALLATGLALYVPALSIAVGRRELLQTIHFWTGVGWIGALVVISLAGDWRGLARTALEIDSFE